MTVIPWLIAIPLTALAMGGWQRLIPVIFKKKSRELFARMQRLVAVARFMVFHAVLETYGSPGAKGSADKHARDIVRCLFNDPEEESDRKNPLWPATKTEAMLWLDAHPGWRELVLQTLKAEMIAKNGEGKDGSDDLNNLVGSPIFQAYGRDYPMKIDPQAYTELVVRTLARSSDTVKDFVHQQFHV